MDKLPTYSQDEQNKPQHRYAPLPKTDYPPQPTPGYPPQPTPGYLPQPTPGYPPQPTPGYPPQPTPGYPPQHSGHPQQNEYFAQGHGYTKQPMGYSSQNTNSNTVVVQNQPQGVTGVIPVVDDHMGLSIFACLCCCWPIGIFAIMKSFQARDCVTAGDHAGAIANAETAQKLAHASIICGCIGLIIPIVIMFSVIAFTTSTN